jgi:hypothetical protein
MCPANTPHPFIPTTRLGESFLGSRYPNHGGFPILAKDDQTISINFGLTFRVEDGFLVLFVRGTYETTVHIYPVKSENKLMFETEEEPDGTILSCLTIDGVLATPIVHRRLTDIPDFSLPVTVSSLYTSAQSPTRKDLDFARRLVKGGESIAMCFVSSWDYSLIQPFLSRDQRLVRSN